MHRAGVNLASFGWRRFLFVQKVVSRSGDEPDFASDATKIMGRTVMIAGVFGGARINAHAAHWVNDRYQIGLHQHVRFALLAIGVAVLVGLSRIKTCDGRRKPSILAAFAV